MEDPELIFMTGGGGATEAPITASLLPQSPREMCLLARTSNWPLEMIELDYQV